MASASNYFFNSPYIAQAAQSLASAFTQDPEKMMERKRADWEFKRAQELASYQDKERQRNELGDTVLGKLAVEEDAINPVTGKVDYAQTQKNLRNIASEGYAAGREYVEPINKLLGIYSNEFERDMAMKAIGVEAQEGAMDRRFGYSRTLQNERFENEDRRDRRRHGFAVDLKDINYQHSLALQADRHAQRLAEQRAAALARGETPPPMIATNILQDIEYRLDLKLDQYGDTMDQRYKDKLVDEISLLTQQNKSVQTAVNQVWKARGLESPRKAKQQGRVAEYLGLDPEYEALVPTGYDDPMEPGLTPQPGVFQPPVTPGSFGAAATGGGAAPLPDDRPPPNALLKLREGVNTTFGNNQTWTRKNGVPVRVK